MAGFIYFICYLQACMFRCGGQQCLQDRADLWEDEVVPRGPRNRKGRLCRLLEARTEPGGWGPFLTLIFYSPVFLTLLFLGSSHLGLLGATDEPPPSGPSTTQGAQAPGLQQRPQELGELRVLGRDKTGHLRVVWTAQPDTFAHFQLHLRVPDGSGTHEELLPGDVRQALVPSPPPGMPYELSLRGVPTEGEPSAPLIYQGIMGTSWILLKPGS